MRKRVTSNALKNTNRKSFMFPAVIFLVIKSIIADNEIKILQDSIMLYFDEQLLILLGLVDLNNLLNP